MKQYEAVIWISDDEPGRRVAVMAESLDEARTALEAEYGVGTVFGLYNEGDANRPRSGC